MWPLIKNNIRVLLARKGTLIMLLVLPIMLFSVSLFNNSTNDAKLFVAVHDEDQSPLSKALANYIARDGSRVQPIEAADIDLSLLDGKEEAVVLIPEGFEAAFLAGQQPQLTIRTLKGQEVVTSLRVSLDMYLSSLNRLQDIVKAESGAELVEEMAAMEKSGLRYETRRINEAQVNQTLSFASGMLFYVLAMSMMQATSLILSEKQWNTLSRLRQAPVGKFDYLIANFLTAVIFLVFNLVTLFVITRTLLPVNTTFSMYLLWFYFGLIWIFFGIFLALVAGSRAVYSSIIPIVTTVFAMLGGCFWPLWLMPPFMQKLAMITPHYWANDAMTLIQKGQSLFTQGTALLALPGFLVLFFALGVFALRRSQSVESFV